jgi:O-antigen/teichoic acid export membrane protein
MINLSKNIIIAIVMLLIGFILDNIVNMALANIFGPERYGDFSVALRVVELLALFCLLGINAASSQFVVLYFKEKDYAHLKGYVLWGARLFLTMVPMISLVVWSALFLIWLKSGVSLHDFLADYPLSLAVLLIIPIGVSRFLSSMQNSLRREYHSVLSLRLLPNLFFLALVALTFYYVDHMSIMQVFLLYGIALALVVMIQVGVLFKPLHVVGQSDTAELDVNQWRPTAFYLLGSTLVFFLFNQAGLILLEVMHVDEALVGVYNAVLTVASVVWLVRSAALLMCMNQIAPRYKDQGAKALAHFAKKQARLVAALTLLVSVLLAIFSDDVLRLFGTSFVVGRQALLLVILAFNMKAMVFLAEPILKYTGHAKRNLAPQVVCLCVQIILCLALIPKYGINGVALSLLVARSLLVCWQARLVHQHLGVDVSIFSRS